MLGSFRLLLATMVVCFHLAQGTAPVGFVVASLALSGRPRGVEPLRTRIRFREAT